MLLRIRYCCFMLVVFLAFVQSQEFIESKTKGAMKLKICIVEGNGLYRKGARNCPTLESQTNIECVYGLDRLDCLRKIRKGFAHFAVFSPEDLLAARWSGTEILVTSELRFHNEFFEYQIVAVVDNEAHINTVRELKGSKFCHPGHGIQNHWTEVLADYFETKLVPRECEDELSLTESKIKAAANFFGPSCKAGPWVSDPVDDRALKNKYPSLCQLCYNPYQCGIGDKHWGRRGPLYCLTSGAGDVAWVRLDDVRSHFGLSGLPPEANPSDYSFLCPDGHLQPLDTKKPCVWLAKPWPAVAAQRSVALRVQDTVADLTHDDIHGWQNALLMLLETYHVNVSTLDNTIPVDDYLDQAVGFQDAYSLPSCNPPRSILFCTKSLVELSKCSWLQEVALVYGVEPNLQCMRADSLDDCLKNAEHKVSDVIIVDQDSRLRAQRDYLLQPILYEYSPTFEGKYVVIAVVEADSGIKSGYDLQGKMACFPSFEGAAHVSVLETLINHTNFVDECTDVSNYFSKQSCNWISQSSCPEIYNGEEGALRCLLEGSGDVAFMSYETFKRFQGKEIPWTLMYNPKKYSIFCPFNKPLTSKAVCYLNWVPRGHLMISSTTTELRQKEIYNSLREIDRLLGKKYKATTASFTMYGPFDRKSNIIFRDNTESLRSRTELYRDKKAGLLDTVYFKLAHKNCSRNISLKITVSPILVTFAILSCLCCLYF
ncbi:transferrin [Wyeomyia smithii]|uniref:transferrin n=1 Tax=Wyeomyia smithii TaxID=174621 RepID=UPI002467F09C|nr:transferrin [Wyeomyia smithii]XP_055530829.1 transferrin [Wyeomyia smithii]XP_055530831.1 transferrin [Wyeomyia smithii]XP_055530832.1 transferrin [Wyeomyia smithii]XP_055530833.1 transferrin [Wyeomyia smithii]XP_055530834.1 transferrin [Wyeomyia smithii]